MAKHFTIEEKAQWLKSQPRKAISSKVVLFDEEGRLFFTKPNYKPGWGLVGGMVDENESPMMAALREMTEEMGVALPAERLAFLGTRYGVSKSTGIDYIHFLFGARLTNEEVNAIHVQVEEIEDSCWVLLAEAEEKIDIQDHTWKLAKQILEEKRSLYSDKDVTAAPFALETLL